MALTEKIRVLFEVDDEGSFGKIKRDIASADTAAGKMKAGAKGLGDSLKANAAAGAIAAGTAIVAFGVKAVNTFTDTAKAAIDFGTATGLAVEDASRWIAVGDDMGVTAEQLTSAFGKVGKSLDSGKWEKYGIATRDAGGKARDTNDIILDSFDALSKIENQTERTRIGNDLFGKGYANIAPLIGKTRKEMERYLGSVEKGQVITAAEAGRAEDWRLAMDGLQDGLKEVTYAFGAFIADQAPVLKGLASMLTLAVDVGEALTTTGDSGVDAALKIEDMADEFTAAGLDWVDYKSKVMSGAMDLTTALDDLKAAQEADTSAVDLATRQAAGYVAVAADMEDQTGKNSEAFKTAANRAAGYADEARRAEQETKDLKNAYKSLTDELSDQAGWIGVENAIDEYRDKINQAGASNRDKRLALIELKQELISYLSSLEDVPAEKQTEILALIDQGAFDEAERALGYLSRGRAVAISPTTGGQLPNVSSGINGRRASGGPVSAGGAYLVGENGPEILQMGGQGGNVVPNNKLGGHTYVFNVLGSVDRESAQKIAQAVQRLERERR